jgi:hypothetical protein
MEQQRPFPPAACNRNEDHHYYRYPLKMDQQCPFQPTPAIEMKTRGPKSLAEIVGARIKGEGI